MKASQVRGEIQRTISKQISEMSGRLSSWEIWQDMIVFIATSIEAVLPSPNREKRETLYQDRAKKYSQKELNVFPQIFAEITDALEMNPDQDFLGDLFMQLGLGNDWKGQFFTPYSVCQCMAGIETGEHVIDQINEHGWASVNDPACGAGALLVAMANECRHRGINYQTDLLFVAQDVDFLAGLMCYIQLSLLGCPGYVVIADTLAHPAISVDERGLIPAAGQEVWYTPMYFRDIWCMRRRLAKIDLAIQKKKIPEEEKEDVPELSETKAGQFVLF